MNQNSFHHLPVLLPQVLDYLPESLEEFADFTLGGAGHAKAILLARPGSKLFGSDQDPDALTAAKANLQDLNSRCQFFLGRFSQALAHYQETSQRFDFLLADLGVSSHQLDQSQRGFAFSKPGPLDMRMGQTGETAKELLERIEEADLRQALYDLGEEGMARKVASAIKQDIHKIETTQALADLIYRVIPKKLHPKKIHPATKSFQAIRILVNQELEELDELLEKGFDLLKSGGRLAIISFHSLEDRKVKEAFARLHDPCTCPKEMPLCVCNKAPLALKPSKAITAEPEEIEQNPRSRSAKLRVIEKL